LPTALTEKSEVVAYVILSPSKEMPVIPIKKVVDKKIIIGEGV
jgi:hypothetical protein